MESALKTMHYLFTRLPGKMIQFANLLWKAQRVGNRGPESFTEAKVQDVIYSCRR